MSATTTHETTELLDQAVALVNVGVETLVIIPCADGGYEAQVHTTAGPRLKGFGMSLGEALQRLLESVSG